MFLRPVWRDTLTATAWPTHSGRTIQYVCDIFRGDGEVAASMIRAVMTLRGEQASGRPATASRPAIGSSQYTSARSYGFYPMLNFGATALVPSVAQLAGRTDAARQPKAYTLASIERIAQHVTDLNSIEALQD